MKTLIAFMLFLLIACSIPAFSEEGQFLAVYASPDFSAKDWSNYHPNLYIQVPSWSGFDHFLQMVAKESGKKPIVIDLQVHGDRQNLAIRQGQVNGNGIWDTATFGFVVNHINKYLKGRDVTLLCEACYGAGVYYNSIRKNDLKAKDKADYCENCEEFPKFPIYGMIEDISNYNNSIWLQYHHRLRVYFVDLRKYEYCEMLKPVQEAGNDDENLLKNCWAVLHSFGI